MIHVKRWQRYEDYLDRGDWHVHSSYADGMNTIFEYCQKAEAFGLDLIAFTEHVRKEMDYSYNRFLDDVRLARERFDIRILAGCEGKVLNLKGELDAPDEVLEECDVVIGSFHSFPYERVEEYLEAVHSMLKNPHVDIWGHPTLLAQRRGFTLPDESIGQIEQECIENMVLMEKNLKYKVPPLRFLELTRGARYVVGSDAHRIDDIYNLKEGSK
ncbi:PHP domain-containing protein [Chloroflexota bacterium]